MTAVHTHPTLLHRALDDVNDPRSGARLTSNSDEGEIFLLLTDRTMRMSSSRKMSPRKYRIPFCIDGDRQRRIVHARVLGGNSGRVMSTSMPGLKTMEV